MSPSPSPTSGNLCLNSCHFPFSLKCVNTRLSLLPFLSSSPATQQAGEELAQLPGKGQAPHSADWQNTGLMELRSAPTPLPPRLSPQLGLERPLGLCFWEPDGLKSQQLCCGKASGGARSPYLSF